MGERERERERGGGGKWGREVGREKKSWAAGVNVGRLTKQLHQVITLLLSLHHLPPSFFNPGPSPSLVCLRRHRGRGVKNSNVNESTPSSCFKISMDKQRAVAAIGDYDAYRRWTLATRVSECVVFVSLQYAVVMVSHHGLYILCCVGFFFFFFRCRSTR